jgi:hypothetical protein
VRLSIRVKTAARGPTVDYYLEQSTVAENTKGGIKRNTRQSDKKNERKKREN